MNKIKDKIFNKIYKEFWKQGNDLEFGIAISVILLIYFGSILGLYLKFIYRSV